MNRRNLFVKLCGGVMAGFAAAFGLKAKPTQWKNLPVWFDEYRHVTGGR